MSVKDANERLKPKELAKRLEEAYGSPATRKKFFPLIDETISFLEALASKDSDGALRAMEGLKAARKKIADLSYYYHSLDSEYLRCESFHLGGTCRRRRDHRDPYRPAYGG
jgi:hypothetical protein